MWNLAFFFNYLVRVVLIFVTLFLCIYLFIRFVSGAVTLHSAQVIILSCNIGQLMSSTWDGKLTRVALGDLKDT